MKKIFMIGDSTMQYNSYFTYPQTGWGQGLSLFIKEGYSIENHGKNGRSTKSFIDEGRFDVVLQRLQPGDYVICQFGHNDEKDDPLRGTQKDTAYLENLKYFASKVNEKQATIVFATSISRLKFENGLCVDTHKGYPQAMLEFAKKNNYVCIDLNTLTLDLYNKLGEEKAKNNYMIFPANTYENFIEGKNDTSHLRYEGAVAVAKLFVNGILKTNSPIKECFIDLEVKEEIDYKMLID